MENFTFELFVTGKKQNKEEASRGSVEEVSCSAAIFEWEVTTNEAELIWIILRDCDDEKFEAFPVASSTFSGFIPAALMFAK